MTNRLSSALRDAMAQLNHCWPRWREIEAADIRLAGRVISGPLPDPWVRSTEEVRALLRDQPSLAALNPQPLPPLPVDVAVGQRIGEEPPLAALNPQPLPPLPVDVAVGLEIADRLIGMATIASQMGQWLVPESSAHDALASRLAAEVEELCPPRPKPIIKMPHGPHPAPGPDPHEVELSPLAQLAIAARFEAVARSASTDVLRHAFKHAAERLSQAGLTNLNA